MLVVTAVAATGNNHGYFDFAVDGTRWATEGTDGIAAVLPNLTSPVGMTALITGLWGHHTITVQWRVNSGSLAIRAGSGSATFDQIPVLWGVEVS